MIGSQMFRVQAAVARNLSPIRVRCTISRECLLLNEFTPCRVRQGKVFYEIHRRHCKLRFVVVYGGCARVIVGRELLQMELRGCSSDSACRKLGWC